MRTNNSQWLKWMRVYLNLELLETRTPVSENLNVLSSAGLLGGLATAYSSPPPILPKFRAGLTGLLWWTLKRRFPGCRQPAPKSTAPFGRSPSR